MHPHTFTPIQWPRPVVVPYVPRVGWEPEAEKGIAWILDTHWLRQAQDLVCVHIRPVVVAAAIDQDHAVRRALETSLPHVQALFGLEQHQDAIPLCRTCGGICTVHAVVAGNNGHDVHANIAHNPYACIACTTTHQGAVWTIPSAHQRLDLTARWQDTRAQTTRWP